MKLEINAKQLKTALKTVGAVFGLDKAEKKLCEFSLEIPDNNENSILTISTVFVGVFVQKRLRVKGFRPGKIVFNLKDLDSLPVKGTVIIDASNTYIRIKCGRSDWYFNLVDNGDTEFSLYKEDIHSIKPSVLVPTSILRSAAITTSFKVSVGSSVSQILIDSGTLEYLTREFIGVGRYKVQDSNIKVKNKFEVLVGSDLLKYVLKDTNNEKTKLGTNEDKSLIKIDTGDVLVVHPCTTGDIVNLEEKMETWMGTKDIRFTAEKANLQKAVTAISPVVKKGASVSVVVKNDKVYLVTSGDSNSARHKVETIDVLSNTNEHININVDYFSEFVKIAPNGFPIQVEIWNKLYTYLKVQSDPIIIEYVAMNQN